VNLFIAITAEVVGPQRIDGDYNDVQRWTGAIHRKSQARQESAN
jgi:hypothetical protein